VKFSIAGKAGLPGQLIREMFVQLYANFPDSGRCELVKNSLLEITYFYPGRNVLKSLQKKVL
jgi:hypothetical protein